MYSFVIPTHNRPHALRACLESIDVAALHHCGIEYEVVVVVCGANGGADALSGTEHGRLRVLQCSENKVCRARNAGIRAATGRYVVLIDDDATVSRDFFSTLDRELSTTDCRAFSVRLLDPVTKRCFARQDERERRRHLRRTDYDLFRGTALVVERELLMAVGFYDEAFGPGGKYHSAEESDLFFRILQRDERVMYLASVIVFHPASDLIDPTKAFRYAFATGALLAKHTVNDVWHAPSYMYLFARRIGICAVRQTQVLVCGKAMRAKAERNRYGAVLKGLVLGALSYVRWGA